VSQYRDQLVATQYCRLRLFQRKKSFSLSEETLFCLLVR